MAPDWEDINAGFLPPSADSPVFSQDGRVFIWTCDDASSNMWSPKLLHKFNDVVWHVSWSITANILAVSGGDNKVHPFSVTGGQGAIYLCLLESTVEFSI